MNYRNEIVIKKEFFFKKIDFNEDMFNAFLHRNKTRIKHVFKNNEQPVLFCLVSENETATSTEPVKEKREIDTSLFLLHL